MESWGNSLSCWWENTPLQAQLEHCSSALSEVVADRFNNAKGQAGYYAASQASPECSWVKSLDDTLQLPDFPSFGGLPDFQLPVQLLPWGVQKWQEIGDQSALPTSVPTATSTSSEETSFSWAGFGLGAAGMTSGALMAFALTGRKRRGTTVAARTPSSANKVDMSALHAKAGGNKPISA